MLLYKCMIFPPFWLTLISICESFYLYDTFLSTANKYAITIMAIIINVKTFLERHFCGISINSFRKKTTFFLKKPVLYTTNLK